MKILEHLRDPRAAWPALIILVIVVSLAVIALPIGTAPPPAFYTAASQIMPLLLIALAVEGRARDLFDAFADVFRIQLITVLCVGETVAIMAASGIVSNSTTYAQNTYGLVGPSYTTSEIMAAVTALSLVSGFLRWWRSHCAARSLGMPTALPTYRARTVLHGQQPHRRRAVGAVELHRRRSAFAGEAWPTTSSSTHEDLNVRRARA